VRPTLGDSRAKRKAWSRASDDIRCARGQFALVATALRPWELELFQVDTPLDILSATLAAVALDTSAYVTPAQAR
jgi:hypothetical protein